LFIELIYKPYNYTGTNIYGTPASACTGNMAMPDRYHPISGAILE
jgi:hypothetical protein